MNGNLELNLYVTLCVCVCVCVCYTVTIHHISRLTCVSSGMVDFSVHIYLGLWLLKECSIYMENKMASQHGRGDENDETREQ